MNKINWSKHLKSNRFLIVSAVVIFLVAGFFGYILGHQNLKFEHNLKPVIANRELFKPRNIDFSVFWDVWNRVSANYVGEIDTQKMVDGAIKGMVSAIGDPYTYFMDKTESQNFAADLAGEFSGIGAQLGVKKDIITIIAPLQNSPAEKAGLKPLDQVLKVNNADTSKMTVDKAVSLIRGDKNTKVTLQIMREGWSEPKDFEITRAVITVKSVRWEMKDGNIAYIAIDQFGDDTTDLMRKAAAAIVLKKPKAIILDLRNNPGGYLQSSVDVTGLFVPKGTVVVKEKNKAGEANEDKTIGDPVLKDYKIYILVNGGSASAAEITAGALQDINGSILIGEKTFGKGSVQNLEELADGATLRVTIAHWFTPKDRAIDKVGIEPSINIGLSEDDAKANRDPQLDRALEEARK